MVSTMELDIDQAAAILRQLGNRTRLEIVRLLVRAGPDGIPVGEIQAHLQIPGSTLSHHITRLRGVCLVEQRRAGTTLYCSMNYALMDGLVGFVTHECCVGTTAPAITAPQTSADAA